MKDVEKLEIRPFTKFCMSIGAVPSSYLSALTIEEQLLWFCSYLEKEVIPAVNNNAEAVEELQGLFTELQNYVAHYFDNLDVQEEIDNKLDEMAESGELVEIISAYLNVAGILAFNTKDDMKASTNLINGSFVKTYGTLTYNDGLGEFYKIRTKTNEDVIDNVNIIAITNDDTIIAELIPNATIEDIQDDISDINDSITSISGDIDNLEDLVDDVAKLPHSKNEYDIPTIMIGDSYACGETAGGTTTGWCDRLKTLLNLSNDNYYKLPLSGLGFVTSPTNFLTELQAYASNIPNKNKIRSIIVCGGYNDARLWTSAVDLGDKILAFVNYCKTTYPNAIVYLGMVGQSSDRTETGVTLRRLLNHEILTKYQIAGDNTNARYLSGVENLFHYNNLISSDTIHPTELGYVYLAQWIYKAYTTGYCSTYSDNVDFTLASNPTKPVTIVSDGGIRACIHDNVTSVVVDTTMEFTFDSMQEINSEDLHICNFSNALFLPTEPVRVAVKFHTSDENSTGTGTKYYAGVGTLTFTDSYIAINTQILNDQPGSGWLSGQLIKKLYIQPFSVDTSIRNC